MQCDFNNKNECYIERLQGFKMCPQCIGGNLKFYPNLEHEGIPVPPMCDYEQFKCDCGNIIYSREKYLIEINENPKFVCKECYLEHKEGD